MNLPEAVENIIETLDKAGFEGFIVGGCVRDACLGVEPKDWDITTSAKPEEVKALFKRTIDTGIEHGTVTVMIERQGYEVTTYRIDGKYKDGRHPEEVVFTPSLEEDLKRRDFTINAMAYNESAGLVDLYGGMDDLKAKRIRCVGDAAQRFREDALRILRALRFSAQLGFDISEETKSAILEIKENLKLISKERIREELNKLLLSDEPEKISLVHDFALAGIIYENGGKPVIFPSECGDKMLSALKASAKIKELRWSIYLNSLSGEEANVFMRALKFDNKTTATVKKLCAFSDVKIDCEEISVKHMIQKVGLSEFDLLIALQNLLGFCDDTTAGALMDIKEKIVKRGDALFLKDLKINGSDLLECGIKKGENIGKMLELLLEKVVEDYSLNDREKLFKIVDELKEDL
ncbi:MAG: CCA tRNA nucleotidyltransferase [Lachnospiraceae bacterium]|nr:CCA tRNA nucleotidyltransferase [Lachnospiraceae bacterium]